jgi:hypothetical protein
MAARSLFGHRDAIPTVVARRGVMVDRINGDEKTAGAFFTHPISIMVELDRRLRSDGLGGLPQPG